jgi:endo-1,4-beta-xylanase
VQTRFSDQQYRALAAHNFTSITPNRSFKWKFIEPEQGVFDWTDSDRIVDYAAQHQLRVRGCCLAWRGANPTWLTSRKWTKAELKQVLHDYITAVVTRYRGRIAEWDVVNEGLNGPPAGPYRLYHGSTDVWGKIIGPEYVADAFRWAHEADPSAQLFYNDYGAESPNQKFQAELRMVKMLKARGVPIDGVGLQMHRPVPISPPYYPTPSQVTQVLSAFQAIGVRTEITEMDQALPLPAAKEQLALQARIYAQMTAACLSVRMCSGITVWGVTDADRYQQLIARKLGASVLLDSSGRPKPAYQAVVLALRGAPGPAAAQRVSPGGPA